MRRREFITILSGAAVAWPLAARAQQPTVPVIGFLRRTSANASANLVAAFRRGLAEAGYIEGQNIAVEYRWAENRNERLPRLAADLVRRQCAVIIAGGNAAALAVKAATTKIPIVFSTGDDPITLGLVASLNRPEGNVTSIFFTSGVLESKQLELLREMAPKATVIGVLINPSSPASIAQAKDAQAAGRALG
jgi:putative ABC transport system substrate-binding protein